MKRPATFVFPILLLLALLLPAAPATAQEAPPPAAVSVEELEGLVTTLEDEAARTALIGQLRALIEAQRADVPAETFGARVIGFLSERVELLNQQFAAAARAFAGLPQAADWLRGMLDRPQERDRFIEWTAKLALILVGAYLASMFTRIFLQRLYARLESRPTTGQAERIPLVVLRALLDLVPIAAFAAVGYALLAVFDPPRVVRVVALLVINANIIVYLVTAAARMLLSPQAESLRLVNLSGESAHYAYIWTRRLTVTIVYGYMIAESLRLMGLPLGAYAVLLKLAGLVALVLAIILILQNRAEVARMLRGETTVTGPKSAALRAARRRLADLWHVLAIAYLVLIYGIWAFNIAGGFFFMLRATVLTLLILVAAGLAIRGLKTVIQRSFRISPDLHRQYPRLQARANLYLPILDRAAVALVGIVAVFAILWAWGIDSFAWLDSPAGRRVVGAAVSIGLVVVLAIAVWEFASNLIERYLVTRTETGETVERSARARTLLPLLRNALLVVLITFVTLIVLAELGINIAPLLAGAGVVGLAIGFGSQTLVKDIITGLFILFEDTISVGDVVNVGTHGGLVEAITIRTIRLRDYSGNVHTVPFSEVTTIMNMTKEFSYYVFDVGVAYREDADEVMQVMRDVAAGMQEDPEFGPLIIEPLDVAGVDRFGDNAVVIKARFKTKPIQQWTVGREYNRRLKRRFDELGIEIPFPQRTVWFGEPKEGRPPAAHVQFLPDGTDGGDDGERR